MPLSHLVFDEGYYNQNGAPGCGYDRYSREMWGASMSFAQIAGDMQARYSVAGRKVLILGCAYGYTVEALFGLGVDAYGLDISAYAVSRAPGSVASRIRQGNGAVAADMDAMKSLAGIARNRKFDLVFDEDILPCLTDAEALSACLEMRRIGTVVAHRISAHEAIAPCYNVKPLDVWRALVGVTDQWFRWPTWDIS